MFQTSSHEEYGYAEVPIPRRIRFLFLLCFNIPAIICTVFLLIYLLFKPTIRKELQNHVIIAILFTALVIQLTDVNFYIVFAEFNHVWSSTWSFCAFWNLIAIGFFNLIAMLLAWAAIERHILVFHTSLVNTQKKRLIFHYIPLVLTIIYCLIVRIYSLYFPPCETIYDYTQPWCGYPCFYGVIDFLTYDTIMNYFLTVICIVIFNLALIIRYIRQRQRFQREIQWRKYRRMILQLLSVCLLVLIFFIPMVALVFAHSVGLPEEIGAEAQLYLYFFNYCIVFLLPFVCLASYRDTWQKIRINLLIQMTNAPQTTQNRQ